MNRALNAGARMVMMGWKNGLGLCGSKEGKEDEGGYGNGLIPCGTKKYGVMQIRGESVSRRQLCV